uniref:CRISPR-associated protein APE2256 family n=1 Tax=uncultured prokaryote TaxID=198431 RepID=H5S946_9ZZZZ|nr:CRISPR-associated protein APE2256 family [uncultured prokaryote]
MSSRAQVLICTVGTSLITSLRAKGQDVRNPIAVAKELKKLPPSDKALGAEINSNHSIVQKGYLDPRKLYLCVSDTPEGEATGSILQHYYRDLFLAVEVVKIVGLQAEDPKRFRNHGLRSLVRAISDIVKGARHHGQSVIINATGGFKAQISFAGLIGQVLEIPVFYMFETFAEVIELPPLPVSFNFDFWLRHFATLEQLSRDFLPDHDVPSDIHEVLLLREEGLCCLSSLGELFHQGYKERFHQQRMQLIPPDCTLRPDQKNVTFEDKNPHRHPGLSEYLQKLLQRGYITGARTYYFNPDLPERLRFFVSSRCQPHEIEGWYSDGKRTTKFILATTARTELERHAAVVDLTEEMLG